MRFLLVLLLSLFIFSAAANAQTGVGVVGGESIATVGNVNSTITAGHYIVVTNAGLTAVRVWTLPTAAAFGAHILHFYDQFGGISPTNTGSLAPQGGDHINGGTTPLQLNLPYTGLDLLSDGSANWTLLQPAGSAVHNLPTSATSPIANGSCLYIDQGPGTDTKLCNNFATAFGANGVITWPTSGALMISNGGNAPTAYTGTNCTNQFLSVLSVAGAGTCSSVVNATLTPGTFSNITGVGALTAGTTSTGFTINFSLSTIAGNLPVANLDSGTGANALTVWSGDGHWHPVIDTFNSQPQNLVLASPNGSTGTPLFRALVAGDLPASGIAAATYGDSTHVPQCLFDVKGRANSCINVAITMPSAATPSTAGLVKLFNVPLSAGWFAGANPDTGIIIADTPQALTITDIRANSLALAGGAATLDIYDIPSGATTCDNIGGTKINSATFDANTGLGNPQVLFAGSYALAATHSVCIHVLVWPVTPVSNATISVYGAPS